MIPPLVEVSWWSESELTDPPTPYPVLADYIDPETGEFLDLLNSHTPTDGAIIEAYRVEYGSGPAVINVGNRIREVRHTDEQSLIELQSHLKNAVRHLELAGMARFERVSVEVDSNSYQGDTVYAEAFVKDLTVQNDEEAARPFPISRTKE